MVGPMMQDPMNGEMDDAMENEDDSSLMGIPLGEELMDLSEPNADDEGLPIELSVMGVEDSENAEEIERRRRAAEVLYGDGFPLTQDNPTDDQWVNWAEQLWQEQESYMLPILYEVERNRLFADGAQWISSTNQGPWREPPKPKDTLRLVVSMIGPALDWRLQVLSEQRPGVRCVPKSTDPDDQMKAQANNLALEYQYTQQNQQGILREAAYWAQRDGVCFVRNFWDPERGIEDEVFGGTLGDIAGRIYRIEQVRVSPNATAIEAPIWWVLKDVLTSAEAIKQYGSKVVDETTRTGGGGGRGVREQPGGGPGLKTTIYSGTRTATGSFDTVDRYTVILPPNKRFLPRGLEVVCVGSMVISIGPLQGAATPIWRITDGSSDPAFFCKPQMVQWLQDQMTLNAVYSKWVENVRRNSGGRYIAASGRVVSDTLRGGQDSIVEVRSPGDISTVMREVQGFSVGNDAKELISSLVKRLEDATGFNETARGGMSANASGRAILAVREQLERVFAPAIYAAARAQEQWGKVTLALMAWGYEVPRLIATTGKSRPDLGRMLSSKDLDPAADVQLDPETMMPMPRSLKLYVLDDLLAKGALSPEEYRKRIGFAMTNDLQTPDSLQEARALRIVEQMKNGQPPEPMLWQDNEAIHQNVLEQHIILAADVDPMVMQQAQMRWQELAQQQGMKMGATPQMVGQAQGEGAPSGEGVELPPQQAPTMALPNGLAADPLMQQQTQQTQAASQFEATAPQ